MKRIILFCLFFFFSVVTNIHSAATIFYATSTNGGGSGAVDSYDGASLADEDLLFLMDDSTSILYKLDASSGATEEIPNIIAPDSNPGTKRWIRQYDAATYRNRVLNAEMMIDQRNEGAATTTSGDFIVDRFFWEAADIDELVISATRSTTLGDSRYSIKATATTAETNWTDTSEYVIPFAYKFLGYDVADLASTSVNISFEFQSNHTGTFAYALVAGDSGYSWVDDFAYGTASTSQLVQKTLTIDSGTNAISNSTTGTGLILYIAAYGGTDWHPAAEETWAATNDFTTADCTDWTQQAAAVDGYVQISSVQLRVGSQYVPLQRKSRSEYLTECQPYYQKSFAQGVAVAQASTSSLGALAYRALVAGVKTYTTQVRLDPHMVGTPTITFYSPQSANAKWYNNADAGDSDTASSTNVGTSGFGASNPQVATDGQGELLYVHWSAGAEL